MSKLSLNERIADLQARLGRLSDVDRLRQETESLQARLNEIQKACSGLQPSTQRWTLLSEQKIARPRVKVAEQARRRVQLIRERFLSDPQAAQLIRGKDWTALLEELQKATTESAQQCTASWQAYVTGMVTTQPPEALERTLGMTADNKRLLEQYKRDYKALKDSVKQPPQTQAEVEAARSIAAQLSEAHRQFDFSVEPAVKAFLQAVGHCEATLELLTPEVLEWLKSTGTIKSYKIVAVQ